MVEGMSEAEVDRARIHIKRRLDGIGWPAKSLIVARYAKGMELENKRLQEQLVDAREELQDEEKDHANTAEVLAEHNKELGRYHAENKRLREALRKIDSKAVVMSYGVTREISAIARAALAESTEASDGE